MSQAAGVGEEIHKKEGFDPRASTGLFVGVSVFHYGRFAEVPFAVDDAVDLAHLFAVELGLLLPERAILALSGEPKKKESRERLAELLDLGTRQVQAQQAEIYDQLEKAAGTSRADGLFLLTVATHGLTDQGGDFLIAQDSLGRRMVRTGVAVDELFDDVAQAPARRRLVLLDACRERLSEDTRSVGAEGMAQSFADAIAQASGQVVLSGATHGGFAYDDKDRGNGVFTGAILDGLRGKATADSRGLITVRSLADYVQTAVAAWVLQHRKDHAEVSRGIGRRIEGAAEHLPLAINRKFHELQQRYTARRAAALGTMRNNLGRILTGALFDQTVALLPEERPVSTQRAAQVEELLEELEALDGSRRSRRALAHYLREEVEESDAVLAPGRPSSTVEVLSPSGRVDPPQEPAEELPEAGALWVSPSGFRFRFIPPGVYTIGSPEDEEGRGDDELRHEVKLTRGFWLGETPVTQAQWESLGLKNPSGFQEGGGDRPVEKVNWFEAVEFANRLSEKEGLRRCYELEGCTGTVGDDFACESVEFQGLDGEGCRLPTEAEWEVAARAGNPSARYGPLSDIAWYSDNSESRTHAVRGKKANAWELYDMLGNVYEWCTDRYGAYESDVQRTDPTGPVQSTYRVIRGGSWYSYARFVRAAFRPHNLPSYRWIHLGFRLARGQVLRSGKAEPGGR